MEVYECEIISEEQTMEVKSVLIKHGFTQIFTDFIVEEMKNSDWSFHYLAQFIIGMCKSNVSIDMVTYLVFQKLSQKI